MFSNSVKVSDFFGVECTGKDQYTCTGKDGAKIRFKASDCSKIENSKKAKKCARIEGDYVEEE